MKKLLLVVMLATSLGSVYAAPKGNGNSGNAGNNGNSGNSGNTGGNISATVGKATAADSSIGSITANKFVWSDGINPSQGANGDTSGFNSSFASTANSASSSWTLLGANNSNGASGSKLINGATITWGYTVNASTSGANPTGAWWVSSNKALVVDLALDVHAGNSSGAWLFDNLQLGANAAQNGSFSINWTNNGGQVSGFSNFTLFARDAKITQSVPVSPVPEPETYAMLLAALGLIALIKRRKSY
jgi:hypothetical protein